MKRSLVDEIAECVGGNADDGKIYTGVVTMQGPNALNLKGCVAFICQGETWTKIK